MSFHDLPVDHVESAGNDFESAGNDFERAGNDFEGIRDMGGIA